MKSKFNFKPMGISKVARRSATSFEVIWNGAPGGVNFGVVRRDSFGQWIGLYAWNITSNPMKSKNAVAEWMLTTYQNSLSGV